MRKNKVAALQSRVEVLSERFAESEVNLVSRDK